MKDSWRVTYPWRSRNGQRASDGRWKSHVYPLRDLRTHEVGSEGTCWCGPVISYSHGDKDVVTHNSEDGRELIEQHGIQ